MADKLLMTSWRRLMASSLVGNAGALYLSRIAGYVLPLVTLPYLARTLDQQTFGVVGLAQSYGVWLSLFLEYGFILSATRAISQQRHVPAARSSIAGTVMGARLVLLLISVLITSTLFYWYPPAGEAPSVFVWAWVFAVAQGFSPAWFFQGLEKMRLVTAIDVMARTVATIAVLLLVRSSDQGWLVLVFQACGALISTVCSMLIMYRDLPFFVGSVSDIRNALGDGLSMFLFRLSISLYTTASIVLVGMFVSPAAAAYYIGADKIVRGVAGLIGPLSQALYPRMSLLVVTDRDSAVRLVLIALLVMLGMSALLLAGLQVFAEPIIRVFYGPAFGPAVPALRILSLIIPLIAFGNVLGIQWMLPLGFDRAFTAIAFGAGMTNVCSAMIFVPYYGTTGMAYAVVGSELIVCLAVVAYLFKKRRLPLRGVVSEADG